MEDYKKIKRLHIQTFDSCNNNCLFCLDGRRGRGGYSISPFKDNLKGFLKHLIEARKQGVNSILFTSGEPTLNKNLVRMIELSKKTGCRDICLVTNGRSLSCKDFCQELLDAGITEINISVHGFDKKTHNSLTRSPESFEETLHGIKNIFILRKKYAVRFFLNSTITALNYNQLDKLLSFLALFSPNGINLNAVIPRGNAKKFFKYVVPKYSDLANEFISSIDGFSKSSKYVPVIITGLPPCLFAGYESYLGVKESILIKNSKKNKMSCLGGDYMKVKGRKCRSCKYYKMCEGVWKNYILHYGWDEFVPMQ